VNCLEFRRRVGAEPSAEDGEIAAHRASCVACARYQDELRAMDGVIARALAIGTDRLARSAPAPQARPAPSRRRLLAIAASVAVGLAVGLALLVGAPRDSVAREVVEHVTHEPGALDPTAPIAPAALAQVLEPDGARLRPGIGDVTFAARCVVEGRVVPHLVVRTPAGHVTVLLLRHREIDEPLRFAERGLEGVVLPAPRGSIAVVGQGIADLPGVAQRVFEAVDWGA
jgi:Protein of unknown function (DUF3379)